MNLITLSIASSIALFSAPLEAPQTSPTSGYIAFTNLTDDVIHIEEESDYEFDVAVNQTVYLARNHFYIMEDIDGDVSSYQYWTDDIGNTQWYYSNQQYSQNVFHLGGETSFCAIYQPLVYTGDLYINPYNIPFSSDSLGFAEPFTYDFVYESSPLSNKNFDQIKFFHAVSSDENLVYNPVIVTLRQGTMYLPIACNMEGYTLPAALKTSNQMQNLVNAYASSVSQIKLSSQFLFQNGCSNKITINDIKFLSSDPFEQRSTLDYFTYLTKSKVNYQSTATTETVSTTLSTIEGTFSIISKALGAVLPFFTYVIFPGITLGMLITIPLMFSILLAVLRMVKKGG